MIRKLRKYPIGAEIVKGGVHFRLWAPDHTAVDLILENTEKKPLSFAMKKEKNGYFSLLCREAAEGTLYRFGVKGGRCYPDPASRFQPYGTGGPSLVVSSTYPWKDKKWAGVGRRGHVVYEMHIGTFTKQGTFKAALEELPRLKDLGITIIEIMPINGFPGRFGWGYDGVNLFAPHHLYGHPDEVKAFVDRAHGYGIGVILDVVYNHLGPEDNPLVRFSKSYLSEKYKTHWGRAINFDSVPSRQFFLTNARYWIEEFHFDGLRIDATPCFFSSTPVHILAELSMVIKKAGGRRGVLVIGENEEQNSDLLRPYNQGGYGFDMLWNDDFHHTARVRLTGKREAYYTDYVGSVQEFISSVKYGFLYQGQYYSWQKQLRGVPWLEMPPESLMIFLENHDQVANSGYGLRLHKEADPGNYRAMVSLLLLSPNTPLLFQGQEFNSSGPFYYFSDHNRALSLQIQKGRKKELSQFPRLATAEIQKLFPPPGDPATFVQSKIHSKEKEKNQKIYTMFRDLIHLRKKDPVFKEMQHNEIDGAVLGPDSFLLRYFGREKGDRVLIINFGSDYDLTPMPEPLLAPGKGMEFHLLWSSEASAYGGESTPPLRAPTWKLLGHCAIVLATRPKTSRVKKR